MPTFSIKKILVPTDFSDTSLKALDHAILLAKLTKADITLLHVMEDMAATAELGGRFASSFNMKDLEKNALSQRQQQMQQLVKSLKIDNLIKVNPLIGTGRTHTEILMTAKKIKADIIIMGTHGASGIREFMVGSNTYRVASDSQCPVLSIQKHIKKPGFKNILVPFTDRAHSREKVDYAIKMAKLYNATLFVIGMDTENSKSHLKKIQLEANQIKKIASNYGVNCEVKAISEARNAEVVLKHAKEKNADLIVIMSKVDRLSIQDFFREQYSHAIINHSPIPVLSIRPGHNTIDLQFYSAEPF